MDAGERYAVVLYIITPGSVHPMAIEYAADEATENVDLDDGESYISANAVSYTHLDVYKRQMYLITSYEDTERYIGRKADKNRKIYNGMLKTYFYQFMGPKPPKRDNFH